MGLFAFSKIAGNKQKTQQQKPKLSAASEHVMEDALKSHLTSNKMGKSEDNFDTPMKNVFKVSKNMAVKNKDPLMEALNIEIGTEASLLPRSQDKVLKQPKITKTALTPKSTLKPNPASTSSSEEDIPELVHIGTIEKRKPDVVVPATPWKPMRPSEKKISFLNNNDKSSNMIGEFPPLQRMEDIDRKLSDTAADDGGLKDNLRPPNHHFTKQDQAIIKDHAQASMNRASSSDQRDAVLGETSR